MPPALSDDESDSGSIDQVPAKVTPVKPAAAEQEDDEDEDEDEEEYRVEKILKHDFGEGGVPLYQIKWLGYEKKSDLTWEPIENLENATDLLEEYHAKIGGPPTQEPKKKGPKAGAKRTSTAAKLDSPQVTNSTKKAKRKSTGLDDTNGVEVNPKSLPEGSWENLVTVSSILEEPAAAVKGVKAKHGTVLLALLLWDSGRKTQHSLHVARSKCPQKLLDYYEQHLVFKSKSIDEEEEEMMKEDV